MGHQADIWLAGLGMRATHLLPETVSVLRDSNQVLHLSHAPGTSELLAQHCASVVDLMPLYEEGADRLATYKRIAATVLDAALDRAPVTMAVYGHPLVLSVPSEILLRLGPELGMTVRVLPAVSALDCLLADLGVDLVATGLQMHEATDFLVYRRRLLPELATVLWQVGVLAYRHYTGDPAVAPIWLRRLQEQLLVTYPGEHPVTAISSGVDATSEPEIHRFPLARLADMATVLHLGTTVYLPGVPDASGPDSTLLRELLE
jgi:uroporphyrin-III C-methyltransferase